MPSQFRLSSVCCLWRWCTLLRQLNFSAIFFHHTIAQGLYFSDAKIRWWGTPLSPEICVQSDPPPFKQRNFDQYRPIVPQPLASEKSSISTYRKSTTRFPNSHRWTVYVTPKSLKGWHNNAISIVYDHINPICPLIQHYLGKTNSDNSVWWYARRIHDWLHYIDYHRRLVTVEIRI